MASALITNLHHWFFWNETTYNLPKSNGTIELILLDSSTHRRCGNIITKGMHCHDLNPKACIYNVEYSSIGTLTII